MRLRAAALAAALALGTSGCGISSDGDEETDPNDKRANALKCLTEEKGLEARLEGRNSIQVGQASDPRIRFFLTSGQAEAEQFAGRGEGAEQIKSAWLYAREGSEATLAATEECLNEL
jgi:hypothetical protein